MHLILLLLFTLTACTSRAQVPVQVETRTTVPAPKPRKACLENIYTDKIRRCDSAAVAYIKQHADDALFIEFYYGLPASVTLAVGMYESDYGRSNIAKFACNHFGQKYYKAPQYMGELQPYKCKKGTFWQAFSTPRESYKAFANSAALAPYVYPHCQELTPDKFAQTGWGGRKKKRYARHLKMIISRYNLDKI